MFSFTDCFTAVSSEKNSWFFLFICMFNRYLLQFYINFFQKHAHCSVIHFAPHLLKTIELLNYSLNVFVSIVAGKHGRRELLKMLLCRSKRSHSSFYSLSKHSSSIVYRSECSYRSKYNCHIPINPSNTPLLVNNIKHY